MGPEMGCKGPVLWSNPNDILPLGVSGIPSLPATHFEATQKSSPLSGGHLWADLFILELLIKYNTKISQTEPVVFLGTL